LTTSPVVFEARQALARGENERAQLLLEAVLKLEPDSLEANRLLRQLKAAEKPPTAPDPMPDAPARWPRCPHCQAEMPAGQLAEHVARAHPKVHHSGGPAPTRRKPRSAADLSKLEHLKTGKLRKLGKSTPILEDREWGRDALDHAVSLHSTEGIAGLKASKKRQGRRPRR
jgi:hypothetical protein